MSANAAFARKHGFPFPLLCDTERDAGVKYGACEDRSAGSAKRISYLIGKDGAILKAYGSVKAAAHPQEVLDDLRAFQKASRTEG